MVVKTGLFIATRVIEIISSIVIFSLLATFVHQYVKNHQDVPDRLLTLFIVSILACAWALLTTFTFHRNRTASLFLTLIDVAFVGAFIASVVLLRAISKQNCIDFNVPLSVTYGSHTAGSNEGYWYRGSKHCVMQKVAWALAIVNCVLFAITALLALSIFRSHQQEVVVVHHKESRRSGSSDYTTTHRHHHRHGRHSSRSRTYV